MIPNPTILSDGLLIAYLMASPFLMLACYLVGDRWKRRRHYDRGYMDGLNEKGRGIIRNLDMYRD